MRAALDHRAVAQALRDARRRGAGRRDLLHQTADLLHAAGPPYTGVYLYMLHGDRLLLEAFAGAPSEHVDIPIGHGLCSRAVRENRDLNVGDVTSEAEYLACSVTTRSELICLIRSGSVVVGQIDIDSDLPDGFPPEEEAAVRSVADALGDVL